MFYLKIICCFRPRIAFRFLRLLALCLWPLCLPRFPRLQMGYSSSFIVALLRGATRCQGQAERSSNSVPRGHCHEQVIGLSEVQDQELLLPFHTFPCEAKVSLRVRQPNGHICKVGEALQNARLSLCDWLKCSHFWKGEGFS